ncbi:copper chaperone PCu(A)C [Nocardiopsis alba]|uniref:copper chaperone PCu(A)C n=1 Tax=Nocardiopsis alba TaxID=53437 RepID=UPI0033CBC9F5
MRHERVRGLGGVIPAALALVLLGSACGTDGELEPERAAVEEEPGAGAEAGDLLITGAWMPEPANPAVGVVYLEVSNDAAEDDAVVSVSTDASEGAELCRTETTESGASTMRTVEEIPVPAGGTTTFVDGGYHIMVNDIPDPLEVGDTVAVTLGFASRTEVELDVPVLEMTGGPSGGEDAGEHDGHH